MSILLEALRKSEKNQQSHEVPTIHSEDSSAQESESLKFLPMASMLIVTLVVCGWLIWRQYQAPEGGYQPPVALPTDRVSVAADPVGQTGTRAGGQSAAGNAQTGKANVVAQNSAASARTPVESFKRPQAETAGTPTPKPRTPVANNPARTQAKTPAKTPARNQATSPANNVTQAKPNNSTSRQAAKSPPKKTQPARPEPISYWELPDAIRASVPEIKFSVLVYATKPPDRFVLINGQRLREGDSLPSGPVVAEIRRDGVIFTHRLYRFLVER